MVIEFFGAYNKEYPRNAVFRKGLKLNGITVIEHHVSHHYKSYKTYPLLVKKFVAQREKKQNSVIFVPEFNHRTVPLAWLIARITGKQLIFDPLVSLYDSIILNRSFSAHSSLSEKKYYYYDRISFKLADSILADTNEHKKYFINTYPCSPEKIHCIPVGTDDEIFVPDSSEHNDKKTFSVLFYAKCTQMHGVDIIYQAALAMSTYYPNIHFTLIGSGLPFDIIRNDGATKQLPHITFMDSIPLTELIIQMNKADAILGVFGLTEKAGRVIPNKVIQGLAMKKPVITMDSAAIRELFIPGTHLLTCEAGNPQSLADTLLALYQDTNLQRNLAYAGYQLYKEKLTPRPLAQELMAVVK